MKLKQNYIIGLVFLMGAAAFLANSSGVPQAVTKAPGESGLSCNACHDNPGNFSPTIGLEVMNLDSSVVNKYEPGIEYIVRVKVSGVNNPKAYGFQMVSLAASDNSDMGLWSGFGEKVKQISLVVGGKNRKYLEQSSPKINGIFTSRWKAPAVDKGSIDFYFAGLASNLNGGDSGDNNVTGKLTLNSSLASFTDEQSNSKRFQIYPNPAGDIIQTNHKEISNISFINSAGIKILSISNAESVLDINNLPKGLYLAVFQDVKNNVLSTQKFVKQ